MFALWFALKRHLPDVFDRKPVPALVTMMASPWVPDVPAGAARL